MIMNNNNMSLFADIGAYYKVCSVMKKGQEINNQRSCKILQIHSQKATKNRKLRFTSRNWSINTEQESRSQKKIRKQRKERRNLFQQNDQESDINQKSFQMFVKQSFKRGKPKIDKNSILRIREKQKKRIQSARKVLHSENSAILQEFPELEGKKCIINNSKHIKSKTPELRCRRACVSSSKCSKSRTNQVKSSQQQHHQQFKERRGRTTTLSVAEQRMLQKQKNLKRDQFIYEPKKCNRNRIILSVNKINHCVIAEIVGNSPSNLIKQSSGPQDKNISNQLIKRLINFQNEQQQRKKHLRKSLVMALKNRESKKHLSDISVMYNGGSKDEELGKKQKHLKVLESLKISGWEVNGWMDGENTF